MMKLFFGGPAYKEDLYNLQIQFKIFHSHKWFLTVEEKSEGLSLCEVFSLSGMGSLLLGFLMVFY